LQRAQTLRDLGQGKKWTQGTADKLCISNFEACVVQEMKTVLTRVHLFQHRVNAMKDSTRVFVISRDKHNRAVCGSCKIIDLSS
jgi:hypothetical protein